MGQVTRWGLVVAALGVLVVAACSRAVPGTPSAVVAGAAAPATARPDLTGPSVPSPSGGPPVSATVSATATRARAPALESDVLADECLLSAARFSALLDRRPVRAEQSVVHRADGTRGRSCYAAAVDGSRAPLAAINVYRVRSGTPAEFVRAAGGRPLGGTGEAATLLETAAGPTLQVAAPAFLVTLVVQGRSPPDEAWRAAARAALARLPR